MKNILAPLQVLVAAGALLVVAPASAFDFDNLKDLENAKKALSIGKKVVQANREINQQEEIEIGNGVAARVLGTAPLVDDAALQKYVNRVGLWLALQTERPDLPWHFGVIASDDVNAFSTPGGNILVTRGMYSRFRNEAELAGVLAHEIAHVLEKHQVKAIQKALGNAWKAELVGAVAENKGGKNSEHIAKAFTAGTELYTRGLDKQDEFDADRMGVVIAARAGYNPYGLVGALQTLGEINAQDSAVALMFKTHPSPGARLDILATAMGERLDDHAGQVETTKRFIPLKAEAASDAAK